MDGAKKEDREKKAKEVEEAYIRWEAKYLPQILHDLVRGCIEGAHLAWCCAAEGALNEVFGSKFTSRSSQPRGTTLPTIMTDLGPKWCKSAGGSVTKHMDQVYKLRGIAKDLQARTKRWYNEAKNNPHGEYHPNIIRFQKYNEKQFCPSKNVSPRSKNDWLTGCNSARNFLELSSKLGGWLEAAVTSSKNEWVIDLEALHRSGDYAHSECRRIATEERKQRYNDWKSRFEQETEKSKRAVFKQIKDPFTAPASTLFDKKNRYCFGWSHASRSNENY